MPGQVDTERQPSKRRSLFRSSKRKSQDELMTRAREMVNSLTEEEKETAARSSYKYLWKSVSHKGDEKNLKEDRELHATSMALRHLKSKKGNFEVAMEKFTAAIKFRQDTDLDGLRLCFQADDLDLDEETRKKIRYVS